MIWREHSRCALPATCGELVQGSLDGVPCLVSCPIDRYSVAEVQLSKDSADEWILPAGKAKAGAALHTFLEQRKLCGVSGRMRIHSPLPMGRGYGTSTADIGAALYALAGAVDQPLSPRQAAGLAVRIEPTDSTLFPGLALFDHRAGTFDEPLGAAPDLAILVLDPGGEVDTLDFNRQNHRQALLTLAAGHREAFDLLRAGVARQSGEMVGAAATMSACLHQAILPNPLLDPALELAGALGAWGVCRAHSGTLLGLLLDAWQSDLLAAQAYVRRRLAGRAEVSLCRLVDGGPHREPCEADGEWRDEGGIETTHGCGIAAGIGAGRVVR